MSGHVRSRSGQTCLRHIRSGHVRTTSKSGSGKFMLCLVNVRIVQASQVNEMSRKIRFPQIRRYQGQVRSRSGQDRSDQVKFK